MTADYNAFRFTGAGLDAYGPTGLSTTPTGQVAMANGAGAIRPALMLLVSTVPGDRLMRPDYGSYLHRLLFANNDQTTAGLAIHYVRQAVHRWEPRVSIIDIDADVDPEIDSRLNITLTYRIRATLSTETLVYPLDLEGGSP